jgi:hypothetical protein
MSPMGAESIQTAIAAMVQDWLSDHPLLGWCVTHPIWAIALLLLFIFSAWIALLRAPLRLVRWIGVRLLKLFKRIPKEMSQPFDSPDTQLLQSPEIYSPTSTLNEPELAARNNGQSAQLREVIVRLEQLQREQAQLLQDVRAILPQPSNATLPHHVPTLQESKPQQKLP